MKLFSLAAGVAALALTAQASFAADAPVRVAKAPAAVAAPMFNWSGFYWGGQIGYMWGDNDYLNLNGQPLIEFDVDGVLLGLHIGGNVQSGVWVGGWEIDANWSNADGNDGGAFGLVDTLRVRGEGSARLRGGLAQNNWLAYLTGGWAWASVRHSRPGERFTDTLSGWTVGAGISHAPQPNFIWTLEYRYSDYGSTTGDVGDTVRDDLTSHQVTLRASWKFATGKTPAAAPVVTKY
jgi:outer membrane immunogenic protein